MHRSFFFIAALGLMHCTHPQETPDVKVSAPLSGEGKPGAPVEVRAELTPTHARLTAVFEAAAEGVSVVVSGLDGLNVTQAPVAEPRAFKQQEQLQLDVDYEGEGTLVVSVNGTFNGGKKSRVMTFSVGEVKRTSGGTKVAPTNAPPMKALPATTTP